MNENRRKKREKEREREKLVFKPDETANLLAERSNVFNLIYK